MTVRCYVIHVCMYVTTGTNCVVSNPDRLSVVTYTDTLAPFRVRFIFRQPPLSYVANIYSLPFSTRVWVGTAVCAVISAVALCLATRWEAVFGKVSLIKIKTSKVLSCHGFFVTLREVKWH